MLQLKELGERSVREKDDWAGRAGLRLRGEILRLAMLAQDEHALPHAQLEGPPGGGTWFAGHGGTVPT